MTTALETSITVNAAAARALVLPAFNADAMYPKCGHHKVGVRHCAGGKGISSVLLFACFLDTAGDEHLHRACKQCEFEWFEWALDHQASAP